MKPRIAIPVPHSDEDYSSRTLPEYKTAVEQSGGEAVEVPLTLGIHEIAQLMKTCDAVLLPGSPADVDPQKFGQAAHPKTAAADAARDNVDELLLQDAHNMRKPILGICYGVQSLNVWRQGTLVQHIESKIKHTRPADVPKTTVMRHEAVIQPGTRLADAIAGKLAKPGQRKGPITLQVNSSHHQSVGVVGDGLRVVARSPEDGIIEAVEGTSPEHWVVGVQWHPERGFEEDEASKSIFRALVEAAKHWHHKAEQTASDFETAKRRT